MLSKSKRILFGMLHVVMLLVMVHWFLISVTYLREISWLAILGAGLLFLLAWLKRDGLKSAFAWLTRHKKGFLLGAVVFQLIVMVCAELFIRRDAAVVFKGAFDLLKQSSITNYLSRNPNNIPLFLYEKFFYVLFGSSGLWVMQALNILYVNLGAVLLYKLSQKHFNQKTADLVYLFYVSLICYSPYFYSMYTDIPPLPLIALQLWWALDLLKKDQAVSWKKIVGLGILSGLSMLIRPTTIIVMIAFWAVLFFRGNWKVENIIRLAKFEGYYNDAKPQLEALKEKLQHNVAHDLEYSKTFISNLLANDIVQAYYFQEGGIVHSLQQDKQWKKAVELLNNPKEYKDLLKKK